MLGDPGLRRLIDFAERAGVLMTTLVSFLPDRADPWGLVARHLAAVPPGSYLALSHGTADRIPPAMLQAARESRPNLTEKVHLRSKAEVERFFDGLELVPPYAGAGREITYAGPWAPRTSRPPTPRDRAESTVVSPAARDRRLPAGRKQ